MFALHKCLLKNNDTTIKISIEEQMIQIHENKYKSRG